MPSERRSWFTYKALKRRVAALVGYRIDHPVLGTSSAYEIAISALVEELGI